VAAPLRFHRYDRVGVAFKYTLIILTRFTLEFSEREYHARLTGMSITSSIKKTSFYLRFRKLKHSFFRSGSYWEKRYRKGRNSGAGSYGRLAEFKAEVINRFVDDNSIGSVIEFGSGDGNQLKLCSYPSYLGIDVSREAVRLCNEMYKDDETKTFIHSSQYHGQTADLALSLDVVYHLTEDDVFERYMKDLFSSAKRFVIVYSSNFDQSPDVKPSHVRHRKFTDWVSDNCKNATLIETIPNTYPYNEHSPDDTSFADFYIYKIAG
jgi:hypothetical protein